MRVDPANSRPSRGAGVLGSYLAHVLVRGGNDVTALARGRRTEELERDGIVIRHHIQRKTTVDRTHVIESLAENDTYGSHFCSDEIYRFPGNPADFGKEPQPQYPTGGQ
ncbi:ketopantoate reductase family protein [Paenibacillus sp. Dod16]|uniref:ketopantoate reductase family protein n=1 Tax=Paenibacillus sp. Dod16 TaxID=3416392 RepID=UPI003CE8B7B0